MAKYRRWLFGALGWAFGGPLGALFGFLMGSFFDNATKVDPENQRAGMTTQGDFRLALLALLAAVMKVDQKNLKIELEYIKQIFSNTFGTAVSNEVMPVLKELLQKDIPVQEICMQVRHNMDHPARLELLNVLFSLSMVDKEFHASEEQLLHKMAFWLGISEKDFQSIFSVHKPDSNWAYKVLEVSPDDSDDAVRKAYRRMAMKYHPDRVAYLGEDVAKSADEKFKKVSSAWEEIKKIRGIS